MVLDKYRQAMPRNADFAAARHNIGKLHSKSGQFDEAGKEYRKTAQIDDLFFPAKDYLAMLYNRRGENEKLYFERSKKQRYFE